MLLFWGHVLQHTHNSATMVAHLHPRSRSTMSLFTTCLTISFLVVAAPHVLPCPVDRRQFAEDGSGEPRKRRKRKAPVDAEAETSSDLPSNDFQDITRQRECPVPKPGGLIAQVMGLRQEEKEAPPSVVVRSLREKHRNEGAS